MVEGPLLGGRIGECQQLRLPQLLQCFLRRRHLDPTLPCRYSHYCRLLQTGEEVSVLQRWGERDSATGHTSAVNQVRPF